MITLIVLSNSPEASETRSFDQDTLVIGASEQSDLNLQDEHLQETHLKIWHDGERYLVLNVANDPFATLNDLPFGKKTLQNGDILQIGRTLLKFEGTLTSKLLQTAKTYQPIPDKRWIDTQKGLLPILNQMIESKPSTWPHSNPPIVSEENFYEEESSLERFSSREFSSDIPNLPFSETPLSNQELERLDLENLLQEKSSGDSIHPTSAPETAIEQRTSLSLKEEDKKREPIQSLKPQMRSESISHSLNQPQVIKKDPSSKKNKENPLKLMRFIWILLALSLLLISIILFSAFYFSVSDQTGSEEIQAAEAVADAAMALSYAKIYHLKPPNQNWSDGEFLRNSLSSILPHNSSPLFAQEFQGKLGKDPYNLRIYTNLDFSYFLVIAQPTPSLLQWLIPKELIVTDSQSMKLYRVSAIRDLNRLLLNPKTLEGNRHQELTQLIEKGKLIPLSSLHPRKKSGQFDPPKALKLLRPDAENRIYNSPRYYKFSEAWADRLVPLMAHRTEGSRDLSLLNQEIAPLSLFPDLIFYSSSGIQAATETQKILYTLAPDAKILAAYVKTNSQEEPISSYLVMDSWDKPTPSSSPETPITLNDSLPNNSSNMLQEVDKKLEPLPHNPSSPNPLFFHLSSMALARQEMLAPLGHEINILLKQNSKHAQMDFPERLTELLMRYKNVEDEQSQKIAEGLVDVYKEYNDLPLSQLLQYIKQAKLEAFIPESLSLLSTTATMKVSEKEIDFQMQKILQVPTFSLLEQQVQEMVQLLQLERFPHIDSLISYQEQLKEQVLEKMKALIASLPIIDPNTEDSIIRILQAIWISNPKEKEFLLKNKALG